MQEHLEQGVPDLRVATMSARYEALLRRDLPLTGDEIGRLRKFAPRFSELCAELNAVDIPETVQHDDLHMANVYTQDDRLRLLDWATCRLASVRLAGGHVPVPRGEERAVAVRPVVRAAARRASGALGPRSHRYVRTRDLRWRIRAHIRMGSAARPPAGGGTLTVRPGRLPDRVAPGVGPDVRLGGRNLAGTAYSEGRGGGGLGRQTASSQRRAHRGPSRGFLTPAAA